MIKMTPEQLKASILQYAMEGRLVKQDPNDEPVSILLEKIKAEKEKLVKEGKIKKSKKLPAIEEDEKPFDIPDSWEWVRFGDAITILRGGSPRPIKNYLTTASNGINWIKIGDSTKGSKYIDHSEEKIIPEGLNKSREVHKGDFLLSNSMSFGRPYILKIDGAVHDGWLILSNYEVLFDKNYLYYLLSSNYITGQFNSLATGSTVKNLNRERVANTIAVIPPLAEQKRIVAKIEKLMPLVDKYAEAYNRLQKIDGEFKDKLKQTILQYAMEGKLVKQDTNDEPVSILLEKIKAEKEKLVKEGKIKKSKKLPVIEEDEKPFDIPDSWEWVRFGNIVNFNLGKTPSKTTDIYWHNGTVPWVTIKDMQDKTLSETDKQVSDRAIREVFNNNVCQPNTLLMSFKLTIGKTSILNIKAVHNEAIIDIIPLIDDNHIFRNYLFFILPYISQYASSNYAIKGKTLNKTSINNMLIPLPPLAEQKRIVAKIDRMMIQIDEIQ